MKELLKVKDLKIQFHTYRGNLRAVNTINFEIEEGKTTAIVGESGCGKSVTAKAIMGLIDSPGEIAQESEICYKGENVLGNNLKEWDDFRGKECSMIFQDALSALNPTAKVGKQIIENLRNHNLESLSKEQMERAVRDMLNDLGIKDPERCMKSYPFELSGGMRQRVMIAMALITNPKLLIADEPTTALDVTIQAQILEMLKSWQKKKEMSILLITHDFGVVAEIADEIIVMYAGTIVEKGKSEDIFYRYAHPYTWALLKAVPDIKRKKQEKLVTVEGNVPDMISALEGCAFCNRCPYAMNICKKCVPRLYKIEEDHEAACWLLDERCDKQGVQFMNRGETL